MAREALLKNRMAARNKGQVLTLPILKRQNAQQLRLIKRRMEVIEREIMDRIMADTQLACRFEILGSDPRHLSHHSLHPDRRHARARRA